MTAKPATVRSVMRIYYHRFGWCSIDTNELDFGHDRMGYPVRVPTGHNLEWLGLDGKVHKEFRPLNSAPVDRAQADGYYRRAGFLRDDGDLCGAFAAMDEALRLRKLANDADTEADKFSTLKTT